MDPTNTFYDERLHRLTVQRDELHSCLLEVQQGFVNGRFTCLGIHGIEQVKEFALFLGRLDAALARSKEDW
jgi:hypothetical protein